MRGAPFTEGWDKSNVELCELAYNMNWNDLYTGLSGIIGGGDDYGTVTETGQEILDALPETLPTQRQAVVELALSLEGKVPYFWGGKSLTIGWDDRWGTSKKVTAPGNSSAGQYRPYVRALSIGCFTMPAVAVMPSVMAAVLVLSAAIVQPSAGRSASPVTWCFIPRPPMSVSW